MATGSKIHTISYINHVFFWEMNLEELTETELQPTKTQELVDRVKMVECFGDQTSRYVKKFQCNIEIDDPDQCPTCLVNNKIWKHISQSNSTDYRHIEETQKVLSQMQQRVKDETKNEELKHGPMRAAWTEMKKLMDDPLHDDVDTVRSRDDLAEIRKRAENIGPISTQAEVESQCKREELIRRIDVLNSKRNEILLVGKCLQEKDLEIGNVRKIVKATPGVCNDIICKNKEKSNDIKKKERSEEKLNIEDDIKTLENDYLMASASVTMWRNMFEAKMKEDIKNENIEQNNCNSMDCEM